MKAGKGNWGRRSLRVRAKELLFYYFQSHLFFVSDPLLCRASFKLTPHSQCQDSRWLYLRGYEISNEPWPGSTSLSSYSIPMFEIANGNEVARSEHYKETSLEALVLLATVIVSEHREHTPVW